MSASILTVDLDTTYQRIEGFGASGVTNSLITDQDFIDFIAYDLGFSLYRTPIENGLSRPVEEASTMRWESDFDLTETGGGDLTFDTIAFAKGVAFRRPEAHLIGTVWSPPAWMKDNLSASGSRSGFLGRADPDNRLSDDKYDHFAHFLLEYTELFKAHGASFYAISPANELMFTQTFHSCLWTADEYARFVRLLGQTFETAGVERPLVFGPEDMTLAHYNTSRHRPYVDALMAEDTAPYFDVFATHGYTDGFISGATADPALYWSGIEQFDRPFWITEGGTGGHDWPEPIETGIAAYLHHALVGGNVSAFAAWQITDPVANEHGVMVGGQPTKKTYAAMHFWRYVRPGFVRVAASLDDGESSGLRVSAFRDEARARLAVIVINPEETSRELDLSILGDSTVSELIAFQTTATSDFEEVATIALDASSETLTLPAGSITTFANSIPVASLEIGPTTLPIDLGGTAQFLKRIEPESATYPKLTFESSDESVATVNNSGVVTAHAKGSAVVTATAVDGGAQASTEVIVSFLDWAGWPVDSESYVDTGSDFLGWIFASDTHDWIYSYKLGTWLYLPEESVHEGLTWVYLSNVDGTEIPTTTTTNPDEGGADTLVDPDAAHTNVLLNKSIGVSSITPGNPGENLIDDSYGSATSLRWITTEYPQWAKIDLEGRYQFSEFRLYPWESRGYLYKIEVSDDDVNYTTVVDRTESNETASVHIDSVDASGRYVLLTVESGGEYGGNWVNLHELQGMGSLIHTPVSGIQMVPSVLQRGVGQEYQLAATLLPEIATNKGISWSSADPAVATVDQSGRIETVGQGETLITATSEDGGLQVSTTISVGELARWAEWEMSDDRHVETGNFAGELFIDAGGEWVYLIGLSRWAYLPEQRVTAPGCWAALYR